MPECFGIVFKKYRLQFSSIEYSFMYHKVFRWVKEDTVQFFSALSLLPSNWTLEDAFLTSKIRIEKFILFENRNLRESTCNLAEYLNIELNTKIKIQPLITRICEELQLPST